jgi:hypothetical protein
MAEETTLDATTPAAPGPATGFKVPPAPTLGALNAQMTGVPAAPSYNRDISGLKTAKDVSQEQAKLFPQMNMLEQQIGAGQAAQKEYEATAAADIARQTREKAQQIETGFQKTREEFPYPEFHPTQDNLGDIATLFSLIGVVGTAIGGAGKLGALGALNSMSGMMKGWQQGRRDLWEKEKQEYDKNMARVKTIIDDAAKDSDRAMKLLAYDRDEASALATQSAAKLGGQIGKQILERQGVESYFNFLNGVKKDFQNVEAAEAKHKEKVEDREAALRRTREEIASRERVAELPAREAPKAVEYTLKDGSKVFGQFSGGRYLDASGKPIDTTEVRAVNTVSAAGKAGKEPSALGPGAFLRDTIGVAATDEKTNKEIVSAAEGINELNKVSTLFRDPDVRTGVLSKLSTIRSQLASLGDDNHAITDEEMRQVINNNISPTAKNAVAQKDALFAAYAAEREASGTGRLLVSVVKQAGGALDPSNYQKEGYLKLLNDREDLIRTRLRGYRLNDDQIDDVVTGVRKEKRGAGRAAETTATEPTAYMGTRKIVVRDVKGKKAWVFEDTGEEVQ